MDDETARAPFSVSVNVEGRIAEVELARIVSAGAAASSRANMRAYIDVLRRALLDIVGAGERVFERRGDMHSRANSFRDCPVREDRWRSSSGRSPRYRPEPWPARPAAASHSATSHAGPGETDRPGAADETRPDHCDFCHIVLPAPAPIRHNVSTLASTPIDWPETFRPAGDNRYAIVAATSLAVTIRRIETRSR